jgi:hypothetical protein
MSTYPPIQDQIDPFVELRNDPNYKPKQADPIKIKDYKDVE